VTEEATTIIEVNGIKMEVDLRKARIVHDNLRVGSRVKVLEKGGYSGPTVHAGVIVGFEPFNELPTVVVAYVKTGYSAAGIEFAYINSKSADKWEMVPSVDDHLPVAKADVLAHFEREITKAQAALHDIEAKRDFFLRHFDIWFAERA
jgi:hypothetical protein